MRLFKTLNFTIMNTKPSTQKRAKNLSLYIYGYITNVCKWNIQNGEQKTLSWIKAIEKKYNVIA